MRKDYLPYFKPYIDEQDIAAVVGTLREGWLTSGPKAQAFEDEFSTASGMKYAVALNSCTSGLHLALVALGIGPGDEVVMPSFTFVAGAECVSQLGGRPVFCDVDDDGLCVTRKTIEPVIGPRTKAIIAMHYGGHPCDIRSLAELAKPRGIHIIEDAAHGLGTVSGGHWPGFYSDAAAYSFYATKNITTGEGGMLVTNDKELAKTIRVLSLHGIDRDAWRRQAAGSWEYDVVRVGYKFNMPDMAAALGSSQFGKLLKLQARRDELANFYSVELSKLKGIRPVTNPPILPDRHSWCIYAVAVDERALGISRDHLARELHKANIGTSVHFIPTHKMTAYKDATCGPLPTTERIARTILSLPLYPGMSEQDVVDVVEAVSAITRTDAEMKPGSTSALKTEPT